MPATTALPHEEENKRRSAILTGVLTLLLLALIIYPWLTYPVPPLGQEGILVNLGLLDVGQGDENAAAVEAPVAEQPQETEAAEQQPEPLPEPESLPEPLPPVVAEVEPEPVVEPTPEPKVNPELIRQQEAAALALRERKAAEALALEQQAKQQARERAEQLAKQQEAQAAREAQAERERVAAAEAAAEKQRQAKAAARAAAEAKAAKLREATEGLFAGGGGTGGGKGTTGTAGNQGDRNGDPSASRLTGLSSGGAGQIGGGLESRGVLSSPKLTDNSQRKGRVVVKICVDAQGQVTSATYTQRGSTTSDQVLKQLAIANAKAHKFSASSAASQCGNITYDFVVQ